MKKPKREKKIKGKNLFRENGFLECSKIIEEFFGAFSDTIISL